MRDENVNRLNSIDIEEDDLNYLHYKYYHEDLFKSFSSYVRGKVLDIGCGNKPYEGLIGGLASEYLGCDIIQSSRNCVDIISPANRIPLPDNSFDTVVSTQTIEHVEDHNGMINEAYRVLNTGGHFIVSGPLYWPLHEEPYDFFRFTKHGFRYILEKAGFQLVSINSNGGKWSVAGQSFLHALYPQVNHISGIKGSLIRRCIKLAGGVKTINRFFIYLDKTYMDDSNTMNYVIVAKK